MVSGRRQRRGAPGGTGGRADHKCDPVRPVTRQDRGSRPPHCRRNGEPAAAQPRAPAVRHERRRRHPQHPAARARAGCRTPSSSALSWRRARGRPTRADQLPLYRDLITAPRPFTDSTPRLALQGRALRRGGRGRAHLQPARRRHDHPRRRRSACPTSTPIPERARCSGSATRPRRTGSSSWTSSATSAARSSPRSRAARRPTARSTR